MTRARDPRLRVRLAHRELADSADPITDAYESWPAGQVDPSVFAPAPAPDQPQQRAPAAAAPPASAAIDELEKLRAENDRLQQRLQRLGYEPPGG